jgi:hypothetical protein
MGKLKYPMEHGPFIKHGDFSWLTVELPEGICCRLLFLGHCDVETSNDVRSQATT